MPSNRVSPLCFNLRSSVRSYRNLTLAIACLRQYGKFCTPSISVDGTVVAGETPFCQEVGTIFSSELDLLDGIIHVSCNECGTWKNLKDF